MSFRLNFSFLLLNPTLTFNFITSRWVCSEMGKCELFRLQSFKWNWQNWMVKDKLTEKAGEKMNDKRESSQLYKCHVKIWECCIYCCRWERSKVDAAQCATNLSASLELLFWILFFLLLLLRSYETKVSWEEKKKGNIWNLFLESNKT